MSLTIPPVWNVEMEQSPGYSKSKTIEEQDIFNPRNNVTTMDYYITVKLYLCAL